tara:strand:- start:887 stop:2254 length:1368 start_codon:yes stop_codon:yes gene_type:complete
MAHSSCGNSSNISGNLNVRNITNSGARLLMTHALSGFSGGRVSNYIGDDGITAGDAIRYDVTQYLSDGETESPSYEKYRKAQADLAENAEIIGIVESVDDSVVNVVLSGQMIYPDRLVNATHIDETLGTSGATGGNDVYFLSEVTAGAIQNLAPNTPTQIAKPILQQAADGTYTHHVVNYIGYQIGGSVVASVNYDSEPLAIKSFIDTPNSGGNMFTLNDNQWDANEKNNFAPLNDKSPDAERHNFKTFNNVANGKLLLDPFGARYCFESLTGFVSSLWLNKAVYFIDGNGQRVWTGLCTQVNDKNRPNTNCIYVTTSETTAPSLIRVHSSSGEQSIIGDYIGAVTKTDVALPRVPNKNTDITAYTLGGVAVPITERYKLEVSSDQGDGVADVPSKVTVKELTVTGTVTVENSAKSVADLAGTINTLADELASLKTKLLGDGASTDAITSNITTK